jgi:hypothetical protein
LIGRSRSVVQSENMIAYALQIARTLPTTLRCGRLGDCIAGQHGRVPVCERRTACIRSNIQAPPLSAFSPALPTLYPYWSSPTPCSLPAVMCYDRANLYRLADARLVHKYSLVPGRRSIYLQGISRSTLQKFQDTTLNVLVILCRKFSPLVVSVLTSRHSDDYRHHAWGFRYLPLDV